jgi:hypothetical protein
VRAGLRSGAGRAGRSRSEGGAARSPGVGVSISAANSGSDTAASVKTLIARRRLRFIVDTPRYIVPLRNVNQTWLIVYIGPAVRSLDLRAAVAKMPLWLWAEGLEPP